VQSFERGQIAWSPDTGSGSSQVAWHEKSLIHFTWGPTDPFAYDRFLVRLDRDGVNVTQMDVSGSRAQGQYDYKALSPGLYRLVVEGCDGDHGSTCRQGWTNPVYIRLTPADFTDKACALAIQPDALEVWTSHADGLGCPTGAPHAHPDGPGWAQDFEHGQIVFSPNTGTRSYQVAVVKGRSIHVDWSDTSPYSYMLWNVRFDLDGQNLFQEALDHAENSSHSSGGYERGGLAPGIYKIRIEGCDRNITGSTCRQGWTNALTVNVGLETVAPTPAPPPRPPSVRDRISNARERIP
jgi:hypothetical protein